MSQSPKTFLGDDFLLDSEIALRLYHDYAAALPIIDYHNHLSPKDISVNRKFTDLTDAWLEGDHYKWRAMRANGIAERFCTGDASNVEKFNAWAKTVPAALRNPLYHWTHLELKNYFGISDLLNEDSAGKIYRSCNELLGQDSFRVQGLLHKMNVSVVCTTDDPTDSLEYHTQFASSGSALRMFPSFRPDNAYRFDNPDAYNVWVGKLESASGIQIGSLDNLLDALKKRIHIFAAAGCRSADHGLESLWFDSSAVSEAPSLFLKIREGRSLTGGESLKLRAAILFALGQYYHEVQWVQQFHLGAIRGNNRRMLEQLGPDTGFDSVGDFSHARHLAKFLNALDYEGTLAKTILYNLNPAFNEVFATMAANFNDGSTPGKIQFGAAWWFLDQKDGIEKHLDVVSNMGLLSRFVGMLTDSRSFLSFPRHEYFRRILCNILANDIMNGEIPNDLKLIGDIVSGICYNNTKTYFNL